MIYSKSMRYIIKTLGKNAKQGFTLIELLVVIAIISVLSALLLANFVGVRQRGRDGQRKSDLRQIQSALELVRSDTGSYPASLGTCANSGSLTVSNITYMKRLPCDPLAKTDYYYTAANNNTTYTLYACLENEADADSDIAQNRTPNLQPSCASTGVSFTIENP